MLEVVFSDSAKGGMKAAKNYRKESMLGGACAYFGEKPSQKELEKLYEGQAIGGSSQDVVCIGFNLDIGDITCELDGKERKKEFVRVFGSINFEENDLNQFFRFQREDLEKLIATAKKGKPMRVWKSNTPFSVCAFAFLCDVLRDIDCKISVISLPEYLEAPDGTLIVYTDWAEVSPGKFYQFISLARELPAVEKRLQSDLWKVLKAENAPLRAVINGKLISVPEDFYDHIIIKSIFDGEVVMGRLIGNILGQYPLGVGDGWYALRINKMIDDNLLTVIENKNLDHPYGRVLKWVK